MIRTNGGNLNISATTDNVSHYGLVNTLTITAIKNKSYHEHGFVYNFASIGEGHFVAESDSIFHQTRAEFDEKFNETITADVETGATFGGHYFVNKKCIFCDADECAHNWVEEITNAPTCTASGIKTLTCSICNETKTEVIPATGHNWDEGTITMQATCGETGTKTLTCLNACGETTTEIIPATGLHTYGAYTSNDEIHTHVCSICSHSESENHNTDGENGSCSICGYSSDPCVEGHTIADDDWIVLKEQTCTENGTKLGHCSVCNNWVEEEIPMHHIHDANRYIYIPYNSKHFNVCAICFERMNGQEHDTNGENGYCSVCGEKTSENCENLGLTHLYKIHSSNSSGHWIQCVYCMDNINGNHDTDGENGTCSKCGYKPCEHEAGEWTITIEPTCTKSGKKETTCTKCNKTYYVTIPATGHSNIDFKSINQVTHIGTCGVCHEEVQISHNFETLNENGSYSCECGATKTFEENCNHTGGWTEIRENGGQCWWSKETETEWIVNLKCHDCEKQFTVTVPKTLPNGKTNNGN